MTTAAIIQARFASTRAPGKVLTDLAGRTALAHVLSRCARIEGVDVVVCAVARDGASDVVAEEAKRAGAVVTRGSQTDVLARYAAAARAVGADTILRVTSDCPFIDPALCASTLALRAETRAHYACNNAPAGYPHGLDCEAFTADALFAAERNASSADAREHVTADFRRNPKWRRARLVGPGGGVERLRWTLDWPEDIAFAQALAKITAHHLTNDWENLAAVCAGRKDIMAINAMRVDEARLKTLAAAGADEKLWPKDRTRLSASRTPAM